MSTRTVDARHALPARAGLGAPLASWLIKADEMMATYRERRALLAEVTDQRPPRGARR